MTPEQLELAHRIATPLGVASHVGKRAFGFDVQIKPHMLLMEEVMLRAIMSPEQKFIIFTLPPRHAKSVTLGKMLPLWYAGWFPDNQIIYASYAEDFAKKTGRWVRDAFDAFGPELFGLRVSQADASAGAWGIEGHQGGMISVGRGGPITGMPAHLAIADDLLKNGEEANSKSIRDTIQEWYDEVFRTRLEPGGTMLLFFTRWREDDLIGTLIERSEQDGYRGDQWEIYNFPALAEAPITMSGDEIEIWRDILGRKHGEALWPERYNEEQLSRIQANNPTTFRAMFQGDPRPRGTGWFPRTRWRFMPVDEMNQRAIRRIRIWDLAATEGGGDWTTGTLFGVDADGNMMVLDCVRVRKEGDEVMEQVRSTALVDGVGTVIMIEQERQGSGKALLALYRKRLRGFVVKGLKPEGQKEERAQPYNTIQNEGKVILASGAPWLEAWINEHEGFTKTRNDDMVDGGAYATKELIATGGTTELVIPTSWGGDYSREAAALATRYGNGSMLVY